MATNDKQGMCSELFLLDISTSMGRRDGFWNYFGNTRFDMAKDFLMKVLKDRKGSHMIKVSVAIYDKTCMKLWGFRRITPKEIREVYDLQPDGPTTATYDAYENCLNYMAENSSCSDQERRITIITDGGDNDSSPETVERHKNLQLEFENRHLVVQTVLLQVSPNNNGWRELARKLDWEYKEIRETNSDYVVKDYLISYPSAYTETCITERENINYSDATMNRTAMPTQKTPILQEQTKNTQAERRKTPAKEPVLA